jgi:hypothetical protein
VTTYLGSGDASKHRRDYRPEWLDNLADDVTMEGSVLTGIAEGPEATRAILGFGVTFPAPIRHCRVVGIVRGCARKDR